MPEIAEVIDKVMSDVADPSRAIFNFHCPPYDTQIDQGPVLGDDMRMRSTAGGVETHPVGSTACRSVIERYQPLLGFHGHLHESRGTFKLGKTLCINPGSAYCESLPLVCSLASMQMRMSPAEALSACTVNAAHVLGRSDRLGRLAPGFNADVVLIDAPDWRYLAYHFGGDLVSLVVKDGAVLWER